jgi:hypothetical protein
MLAKQNTGGNAANFFQGANGICRNPEDLPGSLDDAFCRQSKTQDEVRPNMCLYANLSSETKSSWTNMNHTSTKATPTPDNIQPCHENTASDAK